MTGKIKSFNPKKGYGFVLADDKELYFHRKECQFRLPPAPGMRVEFDPPLKDEENRVTNVRLWK